MCRLSLPVSLQPPMASGLPGAVLRRRLRGKQSGTATPVGGEVLPTAGADAIAWERALGEGEPLLPADSKRLHKADPSQ